MRPGFKNANDINSNMARNDNSTWLYRELTKRGYNLGTEEEYNKGIEDQSTREWLYNSGVNSGINMGSLDDFEESIGYGKTKNIQAQGMEYDADSAKAAPATPKEAEKPATSIVDDYNASTNGGVITRGGQPVLGQNGQPLNYIPKQQRTGNAARSMSPDSIQAIKESEALDSDYVNSQEYKQQQDDERQRRAQMEEQYGDVARETKREANKKKWKAFGETMAYGYLATRPMAALARGQRDELFDKYRASLKEYAENKLVSDQLDEAIDYMEQSSRRDAPGADWNLTNGVWDAASRLSTWDMGYSSVVNGLTMKSLAEKAESDPESLTETERKTLDAVGLSQAMNEAFQSNAGIWYNVGASLPESAGFMASMALNPASGLGRKAAERAVAKYGKEYVEMAAKNAVREMAEKSGSAAVKAAAARTLGDTAEMAIMTLTAGAGRTVGNVLERLNGTPTYTDENGYIQYTGQTEQKEIGEALAKGFGSQFVENWTEAAGEYFAPLGKMMGSAANSGLRKVGLNKMADFFQGVKARQWSEMIRNFMDKTKFNGVLGEIMEEELGSAIDATFIGDTTWKKYDETGKYNENWIFDKENQLTTILSCALMSGTLYGVQFAGNKVKEHEISKAVDAANNTGAREFGSDWDWWRTRIEQSKPEEMESVLKDAMFNPGLTIEQRQALTDFASKTLMSQSFYAKSEEALTELSETERNIRAAYGAGYSAMPNNYRDIRMESERAADNLEKRGLLQTADEMMASPDRAEYLNSLGAEDRQAVEDYWGKKSRENGLYDGMEERKNAAVDEWEKDLIPAIHQEVNADGVTEDMVTTAKYDGQNVYVLQDDGTTAVVIDENGEKKMVKSDALSEQNTSTLDAITDAYRRIYGEQVDAENNFLLSHNAQTKMPEVGLVIDDGTAPLIVTEAGNGWATVTETVTDDAGNIVAKPDGKSRDVTTGWVLAKQDIIYDRRDAMARNERLRQEAERRNAAAQAEQQRRGMYQGAVFNDGTTNWRVGAYDGSSYTVQSEDGQTRVMTYDEVRNIFEPPAQAVEQPTQPTQPTQAVEPGTTFTYVNGEQAKAVSRNEDGTWNVETESGRTDTMPEDYIQRTFVSAPDAAGQTGAAAMPGAADAATTTQAEEGQQAPAAPTALSQIAPVTDKKGNVITDDSGNPEDYQWETVEPALALAGMREAGYDDADIRDVAQNNVESLGKEVVALNKKLKDAKTLIDKKKAREALNNANKRLGWWKNITEAMRPNVEGVKKDIATQNDDTVSGIEDIQKRFAEGKRIAGRQETQTLQNGEEVSGHYELVEAGTVTPSHDFETFASTQGFPTTADGSNINDRDYEHDEAAQTSVRNRANSYDKRAYQEPVFVSPDGIVYSGNDRTMSGMLAANQGTDAKYNASLREDAGKYGFTPEQVDEFKHPRLVFVTDERLPYTTETMAKFNVPSGKTQSVTERKVKASKTTSDETFAKLVGLIGNGKMDDFYRTKGVEAIKLLQEEGVIQQNEVAALMNGNQLSDQGRELIETILIGKIFEGNTNAIRMLDAEGMGNVRKAIGLAIPELVQNKTLGEYSLMDYIAEMVEICYNAHEQGSIVLDYLRQSSLFDDTPSEKYTNFAKEFAVQADRGTAFLRDTLAVYNNSAAGEVGSESMFGKRTREDILNDLLNWSNNKNGTESGTEEADYASAGSEAGGGEYRMGSVRVGSDNEGGDRGNDLGRDGRADSTADEGDISELEEQEKESLPPVEYGDNPAETGLQDGRKWAEGESADAVSAKVEEIESTVSSIAASGNELTQDEKDYVAWGGGFIQGVQQAQQETASRNVPAVGADSNAQAVEEEKARKRAQRQQRQQQQDLAGAMASHMEDMGIDITTDLDEKRNAAKEWKSLFDEDGVFHGTDADKLKKLQDAEGSFGFVYRGRIYLDPRRMRPEAALHEYTHLWAEALRRANPKEWSNVVSILKTDTDTWNLIRSQYPELTNDNDIADEVLAAYSGTRGAQRLAAEQQRLMERTGISESERSKYNNIFANVRKAIQDFWKSVATFLGIHYESEEQIADQVLKDFVDGVNPIAELKKRIEKNDMEYLDAVSRGDIRRATELFNEALQIAIGNGVVPYMPWTEDYRSVQRDAHLVKMGDADAIELTARRLAPMIPSNAVLIPMPGRTGRATDMLALAEAVAKLTGNEVKDILRGKERESQHNAKLAGRELTAEELAMTATEDIPVGMIPVFIDNVVDTGATAEAAVKAVGRGVVITLASTKGNYKHASHVKNASPIVYANGRVVPLSERFDIARQDVRFMKGGLLDMLDTSTENDELVKRYNDALSAIKSESNEIGNMMYDSEDGAAVEEKRVKVSKLARQLFDELNIDLGAIRRNSEFGNGIAEPIDKFGRMLAGDAADALAELEDALSNEIDRLEQMDIPETAEMMIAYHGTNADFNAFDNAYMGKGEGAQVHGYGMYVAFDKSIGEGYARRIGKFGLTYEGIYPITTSYERAIVNDIIREAQGNETHDNIQAIIDRKKKQWEEAIVSGKEWAEDAPKWLEFINNIDASDFEMKQDRHLYIVDVPDDNGHNYLTEGKTIAKSDRKRIADVVRRIDNAELQRENHGSNWMPNGTESVANGIENNALDAIEVRERLVDAFGSEKRASEIMSQAGFTGIKYDGNWDGECAVIFNADDIEIIENTRFSIPNDNQSTFTNDTDAKKLATMAELYALGDDVVYVSQEEADALAKDKAAERMAQNKKRALETASVISEETHQPTVVSSAAGAKVLQNLENAKEYYENLSNNTKDFIGNLSSAIGAENKGSDSQYATFETANGRIVTIRIANHNAKVSNFDKRGESEGISIVISAKKNKGAVNDGSAHLVEYFYDAIKLRRAEGKPLVSIIQSIEQSLYSGEYKDSTGLAEVQDLNGTDYELRRTDGTVYGYKLNGKIYLSPKGINPNTPVHEYTHLWATAMSKYAPDQWANIVRLLKGTEVWDEVLADENYSDLKDDDAVASEVLARISGKNNAEKLIAEAEKVIAESKDTYEVAAKVTLINRIKQALNDFWNWVGQNLFGIEFTSVEQVTDRVLWDMLNHTNFEVEANEAGIETSKHQGRAPKKTGKGYKLFVVKDGKLYPPMVANKGGKATPVGVWLDAEAADPIDKDEVDRKYADVDPRMRRYHVKAGGKGTQGSSGKLAYRPGWHLGTIPYALQFLRKDGSFPGNFVWAEVEYSMDNDYQAESDERMMYDGKGKKFKSPSHAFGGLNHIPENGYYMYRTNPNPKTDPWVITGSMKVSRILTPTEVDDMVRKAGREPQRRQDGHITDQQVDELNKNLSAEDTAEFFIGKVPAVQKRQRERAETEKLVSLLLGKRTSDNELVDAANAILKSIENGTQVRRPYGGTEGHVSKELLGALALGRAGEIALDQTHNGNATAEKRFVHILSVYGKNHYGTLRETAGRARREASSGRSFWSEVGERAPLKVTRIEPDQFANKVRSIELMNEVEHDYPTEIVGFDGDTVSDMTILYQRQNVTNESMSSRSLFMNQREELQYVREQMAESGYETRLMEKRDGTTIYEFHKVGTDIYIEADLNGVRKGGDGKWHILEGDAVRMQTPRFREASEPSERKLKYDELKRKYGNDTVLIFQGDNNRYMVYDGDVDYMSSVADIVNRRARGGFNKAASIEGSVSDAVSAIMDNGKRVVLFESYYDDRAKRFEGGQEVDAYPSQAIPETTGEEQDELIRKGRSIVPERPRAYALEAVDNNSGPLTIENIGYYMYKNFNRYQRRIFDETFGVFHTYEGTGESSDGVIVKETKDGYYMMDKALMAAKLPAIEDAIGAYAKQLHKLLDADEEYVRESAKDIIEEDLADLEYALRLYRDLAEGRQDWRHAILPRFRWTNEVAGSNTATNGTTQRNEPAAGAEETARTRDEELSDYSNTAKELAESLGVEVELVSSMDELSGEMRREIGGRRVKGWYDPRTGRVVLFLPNATSENDVKRTILHEIVGHKGLRVLVGERNYDQWMIDLFNQLPKSVRDRVLEIAKFKKWDIPHAMDEYLAAQAEKEYTPTWWQKVKGAVRNMLRFAGVDVVLTDSDIKYLLWRSRRHLEGDDVFDMAMNAIIKGRARRSRGRYRTSSSMRFRSEDDMTDFTDEELEPLERRMGTVSAEYDSALQQASYKFQESYQDSMLGLKKFMEIASKNTGKPITDAENAYMYENEMTSRNQAHYEEWKQQFFVPLEKAFLALKEAGASEKSIINYMIAKHGLERNEVFARRDAKYQFEQYKEEHPNTRKTEDDFFHENREKDYSGLTGLTGEVDVASAEAAAQEYVAGFEAKYGKELTDQLWEKTNAATKATLENSYTAGIIDKERYEQIRDEFEYYIPLRGWEETTADEVYDYLNSNDGPYNAPIKVAEGRWSVADNPIATIGNMAISGIVEANRNRLKQRFLTFVTNHKTDGASVSDLWVKRVVNETDGTEEWVAVFPDIESDTLNAAQVMKLTQQFDERMQQLAAKAPANYMRVSEKQHIPYKIKTGDMKEHQVIVKKNGVPVVITINGNPRAAQAINGKTNPEAVKDLFVNIANHVNRFLSANFTTRNPAFVMSNLARDMFYSNTSAWIKESPAYAAAYNRNWAKVLAKIGGCIRRYKRGQLDMSDPMDKMFADFIHNGGETGYTVIKSVEIYKKIIEKDMKNFNAKTLSARWILSHLGDALDTFGRWAEGTSRFAAYVTSVEMGRSVDKSIHDAKEISVNFNKKGAGSRTSGKLEKGNIAHYLASWGSQTGRGLYVFWNAGVQGLTNFGRMAVSKQTAAKFWTAAALYFCIGAAVAMMASGGDDDDEEMMSEEELRRKRQRDYYNLPKYVRRNNICFRVGNMWVTIPLPIELRAIYGLGELAYGSLAGKEKNVGKEVVEQVSQIMPIDMMEGAGGLSAFVPSSVKPFYEVGRNVDWTGKPLYNKRNFNEDMPNWTKAYKSTSPMLIRVSRTLSEVTGGTDASKGTIDINPASVEHIFEGYLGGVATMAEQASKSVQMIWNEDLRDWRNVPVASRFLKSGNAEAWKYAVDNLFDNNNDYVNGLTRKINKYKSNLNLKNLSEKEKAKNKKWLDDILNSEDYQRYLNWKEKDRQLNKLYDAYKENHSDALDKQIFDLKVEMNAIFEKKDADEEDK